MSIELEKKFSDKRIKQQHPSFSPIDRDFIRAIKNGTLRLHANKRRWTDIIQTCRLCGYVSETLGHVLAHCKCHASMWHLRHNDIQNRLVMAITDYNNTASVRVVSVNRRVRGVDSTLRPDIVVDKMSDGSRLIVDVTVPVEHAHDPCRTRAAFEKARYTKNTKYRPIANALTCQGIRTRVVALIIGALGTWDEKNAETLKELGISTLDAMVLRNTLCLQTLKWARRIYVRHMTMGKRNTPKH